MMITPTSTITVIIVVLPTINELIINSYTSSNSSGNIRVALMNTDSSKDHGWIIGSSASDHMTYDQSLLQITSILASSPVTGAVTVMLTSSLPIEHTLLIFFSI